MGEKDVIIWNHEIISVLFLGVGFPLVLIVAVVAEVIKGAPAALELEFLFASLLVCYIIVGLILYRISRRFRDSETA